MTVDEQLEAITMNLELQSHALEDYRKDFEAHRRQVAMEMDAHRRDVAAEMTDFREKPTILMTAVDKLPVASGAQLTRIEKLERRLA
jgi:hypothetical protein